MTDADLLAKKLAGIETCVQELRTLARRRRSSTMSGKRVSSFIRCRSRSHELFDRLARHGWLPADLAATMSRMAGFRNIIVHGYAGVNLDVVRDVVDHRLGDLLAFVAAIRRRLP